MSVQKLVAALEKEAALRREIIMEKARAEAEGSLVSARARAMEITHTLEEMRWETARRKDKAAAAVERMRARNAKLAEGWRIVEKAFELAGEKYEKFMASPQYPRFIKAMLAATMDGAGMVERVTADPATRAALDGAGTAVEVDDTIPMGFTVHLAGGKERAHFHFPLALAAAWRQEAPAHYSAIFGEARDAG